PSIEASIVYTRETTISEVHEVFVAAERSVDAGRGWRADLSVTAAPTTLARLATKLPDKYPDRDIVFIANVLSVSPRLALIHEIGRLAVEVALECGRTWSYRSAGQFARSALGIGVQAGVGRR
ncbi:MAG: hypothetical protein HYX76_00990, partial [Acidobacteria bacterium]|nr:hypothetical protein [Acidobacteriota bacterium]